MLVTVVALAYSQFLRTRALVKVATVWNECATATYSVFVYDANGVDIVA